MKQMSFRGPMAASPATPMGVAVCTRRGLRPLARLKRRLVHAAAPKHQASMPSRVLWAEAEQSPQDTWAAIEDLWLRLAQHLPVRVEVDRPGWRIVVCGLRLIEDVQRAELCRAALDPGRYAWRWEGRSGAFVQLIVWTGDDLTFTVTSITTVVRWPQGEDLGWQVKGLLLQLRSRS